ncbi:MAG: diguanylate cyclase [Gammaproteobacteria bacterium]|nr:diguanylate cyclase [Gammaproteobacteria bacterium]
MDSVIIFFLSGLLLLLSWLLQRTRTKVNDLRTQYSLLEAKIEEKTSALRIEMRERQQAEVILKASELRNRLIIYSAQITTWEWDLNRDEMVWNENLTELFGHPLGDTEDTKQWWLENIHMEDAPRVVRSIEDYLMLSEDIWREEYRFRRFDGGWSSVIHWGLAVADEEGSPIRMVGAMMDITPRKQAEQRLVQSELNLREAQRIAHLGSWVWTFETNELEWSAEQYKIFGFHADAINPVYQTFLEAIHPEDKEQVVNTIENTLQESGSFDREFRIQQPGGDIRWISTQGEVIEDAMGNPLKMVGTSIDITERKRLEEKLKFQAVHDQLTGLFNRRVLEERLSDEVDRVNRYNHALSVFMLDIDHFKRINDTHGHQVGDFVLRRLAKILEKTTRKTDVLARYGGEEFVVILPETPLATAFPLAERLREEIMHQPIAIDATLQIAVTASIGIASFPDHTESPQALLGIADQALYNAKQQGRNRVSTANP